MSLPTETLRSVRMVEFRLPDGAIKRSVTRGTTRAARVPGALGIADLDPPVPPEEASTVA
jgi:hypothetical protein